MSREVLAPPIQRMDNNRCYRVNLIHEDFGNQRAAMQRKGHKPETTNPETAYMEQGMYESRFYHIPILYSIIILDLYAEDDDDEQEDSENFQIEELTSGHYKLTMHVAQ